MNTDTSIQVFDIEDMEWRKFLDPRLPDGDMAAQVIELGKYAMMAYFQPGFRAARHSHPGGGFYFILTGAMDFGDGRWVRANMARSVEANVVYGPETADPVHGCLFLLVSREPIAIDWDEHISADSTRDENDPPQRKPLGL